jgi:hypothetical protein
MKYHDHLNKLKVGKIQRRMDDPGGCDGQRDVNWPFIYCIWLSTNLSRSLNLYF